MHALETYPLKVVSVCFFPEGHGKGTVDGHFGCMRHWVKCVAGNDVAKYPRNHGPLAPIRGFIDFTPEVGLPAKVFDTVSLRQAGTGIKANCAWLSKLFGKAQMLCYHGITG